jgi:hypothetical protein
VLFYVTTVTFSVTIVLFYITFVLLDVTHVLLYVTKVLFCVTIVLFSVTTVLFYVTNRGNQREGLRSFRRRKYVEVSGLRFRETRSCEGNPCLVPRSSGALLGIATVGEYKTDINTNTTKRESILKKPSQPRLL